MSDRSFQVQLFQNYKQYLLQLLKEQRDQEAKLQAGVNAQLLKSALPSNIELITKALIAASQKSGTAVPIINKLTVDDNMFSKIVSLNLASTSPNRLSFSATEGFVSRTDVRAIPGSGEQFERNLERQKLLGQKFYDPANYPISAPVYYFEGTADHATEFRGASYHYKNSPLKSAYFFAFKNGGHNPLSNLIRFDPQTGVSFFRQAVDGKVVDPQLIQKTTATLFPVGYTDKAGNGVTTAGRILPNRCESVFK